MMFFHNAERADNTLCFRCLDYPAIYYPCITNNRFCSLADSHLSNIYYLILNVFKGFSVLSMRFALRLSISILLIFSSSLHQSRYGIKLYWNPDILFITCSKTSFLLP